MHILRAIYIIWYREVLRYWRNKSRIVSSLGRPILFLFIFGSGLSPSMSGFASGISGGGVNYVKFMFPGIIGMTVFMSSLMSGISIVWDREFGFLKEVLVAPVSRTAVALGKALGGSTVAMIQGTLMLLLAPLIALRLTPALVLKLWPLMFLMALSMTSMGVLIAARMRDMEGFGMIMNFLTMPMFFLSGSFFPLRGLPAWMDFLVRVNPLTYAVDALRQVILSSIELPAAAMEMLPQMGIGVTVFSHVMAIHEDAMVVAGFGALMIILAVWIFNIQE